MNTEEKAQAYDEALEKFHQFKEKYYRKETHFGDVIFDKTGEMQKEFDNIFHELQESEDERIIEKIIDCLNRAVDAKYITLEDRGKCLTYLEKQEDRMTPIYNDRDSFESALKKAWDNYHNGYEDVDRLEDDYVECAHAKGFREGYLFGLEKQKEQKPAESELKIPDWVHGGWDDEYMINTIVGRYSLHAEVAKKRGDTHDYNLSKSMENWLRSVVKPLIIEKQKEQKPAEKPDLVVQLKEHLANTPKEQLEKEWKELEPWGNIGPTVQEFLYGNPAEWSEEDEKMLELVIANYEYMFDKLRKGDDSDGIPDHILIMDWLKSLPMRCPKSSDSWKPSEEQMNALLYAMSFVSPATKESVLLSEIYEQLKKWM